MYHFGVKLRQDDNGHITAALVDLPGGPRGEGTTPEEAYENLIANSADVLTKFLTDGGRPNAITDEKTLTIGITLPARMQATMPPSARATQIGPRDKGWTLNYSWRNNTVSTES
jgi:hypothetical protein